MKNWSNKKHEEQLKRSYIRKQEKQYEYVEEFSTYPTCFYSNFQANNTNTITDFESNKKYIRRKK